MQMTPNCTSVYPFLRIPLPYQNLNSVCLVFMIGSLLMVYVQTHKNQRRFCLAAARDCVLFQLFPTSILLAPLPTSQTALKHLVSLSTIISISRLMFLLYAKHVTSTSVLFVSYGHRSPTTWPTPLQLLSSNLGLIMSTLFFTSHLIATSPSYSVYKTQRLA